MPESFFKDRKHAGTALAKQITDRAFDDPIVLALPRGGIPVAVPVARALHAPLDLIMVKKISLPWQPEYAIGAVVDGDNPQIVVDEDFSRSGKLTPAEIKKLVAEKLAEIERRKVAYGVGPVLDVKGRTTIVVDDGVATGSTMKAAIKALKAQGAARIILAVPVAPASTIHELAQLVDEVICLSQPVPFVAVGEHYSDFRQVSDSDVIEMMKQFKDDGAKGDDLDGG